MSDQAEQCDPLDRVMRLLQEPVPIQPGLAVRAVARMRRQRRRRAAAGISLILMAGVLIAGLPRPSSGTPVTFALVAPAVRSVTLIGDFTDWRFDRVQLERRGAGVWQATVRLRPGRYRFSYIVNHDEWRADTHAAVAPDDFGRPTSVLTVGEN